MIEFIDIKFPPEDNLPDKSIGDRASFAMDDKFYNCGAVNINSNYNA